MKKFFILFTVIFLFSCAGTQKTEDEIPEESIAQLVEEDEEFREWEDVTEEGTEGTEGTEEIEEKEEEIVTAEEELIEEELIEEELAEEDLTEEIIDEEITENIIDINNELTERITDLEQQVLDLQAQLSQLLDLSRQISEIQATEDASQPPAQTETPPPVQVTAQPEELTPPLQLTESEESLIADTEQQIDIPPQITRPYFFPSEEPPVATPSTTIIVPREPEPDSEIIFSRVVRATRGQIIEIPFRGTGWVYLGELAGRRGIVYDSRRNDAEGLSFIFRAEEAGTYALKFSRHDFIRDYILNDHVQVIIGDAPAAGAGWFGPVADRGRVVAQPRWPSASEEAEILRGGSLTMSNEQLTNDSTIASIAPHERDQREPSNISEFIQGTENREQGTDNREQGTENREQVTGNREQVTEQEVIPFDQLIPRAKELFDNGNTAGAIALLDQYKEHYPSGTDELYWLYGQFYEANTPSRNILLSIDYYKRLTNEFPQSSRYNDARRRIAYLERFYINIQ